jgi:hypothetical protein
MPVPVAPFFILNAYPRRPVDDLPHLPGEVLGAERLLDEVLVLFLNTMMAYDICGLA